MLSWREIDLFPPRGCWGSKERLSLLDKVALQRIRRNRGLYYCELTGLTEGSLLDFGHLTLLVAVSCFTLMFDSKNTMCLSIQRFFISFFNLSLTLFKSLQSLNLPGSLTPTVLRPGDKRILSRDKAKYHSRRKPTFWQTRRRCSGQETYAVHKIVSAIRNRV
jgi:hypothetical protein